MEIVFVYADKSKLIYHHGSIKLSLGLFVDFIMVRHRICLIGILSGSQQFFAQHFDMDAHVVKLPGVSQWNRNLLHVLLDHVQP